MIYILTISTDKTTEQIYRALRAAGITSTGSGDYQDMRTNDKAHVYDAGTVRVVECYSEAIAATIRAALNA